MELLIFLIPIVTILILMLFFKKETALWEYIIVLGPSLLMFITLKYTMIYCNSLDTEYLGDVISDITYYEDWDETVMVAHHYTTGSGKHRVTHTYYVPERRYHPARYNYKTTIGIDKDVDEKTFNIIINKLKVNPIFKDMHRNYRSKDGDAYVYIWNKKKETAYSVTWKHSYENKVKASNYSIFKYSITDEDIKNNKLFEYPEIYNEDQNPILGMNVSKADMESIKYINGIKGPTNKIRVFILCFNNKNPEVAELQKSYWFGGNKNEFVVCLGINKDSVMWCRPFSWSDKPYLEVKTRNYFITHQKVNFTEYANWLDKNISKNWYRKSFEDFNYISIELTNTEYIIILILMLLYNIGISYWVINNDYTLTDPKGIKRRYGLTSYKWKNF